MNTARAIAAALLVAFAPTPNAQNLAAVSENLSFDVLVVPDPKSSQPLVHVRMTDLDSGKVDSFVPLPARNRTHFSVAEMTDWRWNVIGELCTSTGAPPLGLCVNVFILTSTDGKLVETTILLAKDREKLFLQGFVHSLTANNTFERTKVLRSSTALPSPAAQRSR